MWRKKKSHILCARVVKNLKSVVNSHNQNLPLLGVSFFVVLKRFFTNPPEAEPNERFALLRFVFFMLMCSEYFGTFTIYFESNKKRTGGCIKCRRKVNRGVCWVF